MAKRGRPEASQPKKQIAVFLEPKYIEAMEVIDFDPFLNRRIYGMRNTHFQRALHEYLEKYYPEIAAKYLREDI